MRISESLGRFGGCAVFSTLVGLGIAATPSFADVPPPINPTLCPTTGGTNTSAGVVATPQQWDTAAEAILAEDPGIDWAELCQLIYEDYNLLPPTNYDPAWEALIPGSPTYIPPIHNP
jgi:hypothetical protein